jgi:predicted dehydrogenase
MNIGIIGTGMIARFHAQAIREMNGGTLHSIYGRNPDTTGALATEFDCAGHSDLAAFLADPDLDAVTIATASGAHLEPAIAALDAGRHVICEKPLEVTPERIDRMQEAAERNGRVLAGILNRRFTDAFETMQSAVAAGRLGRIVSASCYVKWFRDQTYYDSAPWRGTWALDGGGVLMNQAIHTIDQLLVLAGPVAAVQATTDCLAHEDIEVEDTAAAVLEFTSGARGVIEASTASWSSTGHPARLQLCGSEGSVFLADDCLEAWDFREPADEDEHIRATLMQPASLGFGAADPKAIKADGHRRNFEHVVSAIREGREPSTHPLETRKAVELICAIYQSAKEGRRIEL